MSRRVGVLAALSGSGPMRRVLIAYAVYDIVEFAVWVAIILYAYAEGGTTLAAVVAVVQLLPAAFFGPVLAGFGDRMSRGTALALAHAGVAATCGMTLLALVANAPVPVVIGTSMLVTITIAVVRPIHFAALPQLSRGPRDLVSANALSSSFEGLAMFVGPIVAGIGAQVAGPWLVFAGSTLASVVATLLCLRLSLAAPEDGLADDESEWRAAIRGLMVLWGEWAALLLLLVLATRFVLYGALDVLGVAYSEEVLGMGESGAGIVIGAVGVGGMIGGLLSGSASIRRRLAPVIAVSGAIQGLAFASVILFVAIAPATVVLAITGAAAAVMMVAGRTLLQRTTNGNVLARVFAVQEGIALLGTSVGAALAPILVSRLSPAGAFVPIGIGAALFAVAGYGLMRQLDARAVSRPEEVGLLRRIEYLGILPPYELERLAQNAEWVEVPAETSVVRQGDAGDRFYAIAEGEFTVLIDGVARPGRLGPGDGFGELALLRSQPRSATVRSITAARLLAVTPDDFLAAVTGGIDADTLADEVTRGHEERERRQGA